MLYGKNVQLFLHKRNLTILDEEGYDVKVEKQKEYENNRTADEERKDCKIKWNQEENTKEYEKNIAAEEERKD